jgi:hypothetical protein
MNALAEIGYDGYVAAEYLSAGRTEDGLGWMKALSALRGVQNRRKGACHAPSRTQNGSI